MSWPPVSSADAAELREAELASHEETLHDPACKDGWLGEDDEGRPVPCKRCRPHLATLPDGRVVSRSTIAQRHQAGELP